MSWPKGYLKRRRLQRKRWAKYLAKKGAQWCVDSITARNLQKDDAVWAAFNLKIVEP